MPEENFEDRAKRMAEEFSIEPNAEVWLRVKTAITPESRRRVLLWWWLLPLCIAGIAGVFLLKRSGEVPEHTNTVALTTHEKENKTGEDTTVEKPVDKKMRGAAGSINDKEKKKKPEKVSSRTTNNPLEAQRTAETKIGEKEVQYPVSINKNIVQQEDDSRTSVNHRPSDTMNATGQKSKAPVFLQKENGAILNANNENDQVAETDNSLIIYDKKLPAIAFAGKDSVAGKLGLGKATEQKKTSRKKWQMGIVAEAGLTSWGKDLLTKEAKAANQYTIIPSANSTTIDSLAANTSESQRTKNGVDAGIGFTVRKDVAHHFYISGHLSYRYQQYEVYNLRTSSSTFQSFTTNYLVSRNHYHSHFISLYAGAGKALFANKYNALSMEAGLDNSLLLMNGQANKNQSALDVIRGPNSAKADFYKWQPQLFLSLPFDWLTAGKVTVAVSPFVRIGLHSYQKNAGTYENNHLMAAGVQAVYFFR